jgi:hypothetical protein
MSSGSLSPRSRTARRRARHESHRAIAARRRGTFHALAEERPGSRFYTGLAVKMTNTEPQARIAELEERGRTRESDIAATGVCPSISGRTRFSTLCNGINQVPVCCLSWQGRPAQRHANVLGRSGHIYSQYICALLFPAFSLS